MTFTDMAGKHMVVEILRVLLSDARGVISRLFAKILSPTGLENLLVYGGNIRWVLM